MLLTIDAGNTRTKWAVFTDTGEITLQGACLNANLVSAVLPLQNVTRVCVSNVAGAAHAKRLQAVFAAHHLTSHWVKSSAQSCNVINHYAKPETLGVDRWAALIAAWHIKHMPCVVVNAGTAVTIDALVNNAKNQNYAQFVGGMILPGLTLMQTSLGAATAQLPNSTDNSHITGEPFNTNTESAISNGAINAISGAIEKMLTSVAKQYKTIPLVVLSGGDAAQLQTLLCKTVTNQVLIVDNLVLIGLYLLERSQHQ